MASLNGSSPASRPRPTDARRPAGAWWKRAAILAALLPLTAAAEPTPDYARQALAELSPGVPAGWAYTLTTVRNDLQLVERFDPARPPAARWTLLRQNGRAPTEQDLATYAQAAERGARAAPLPVFQRDDLDPASLVLVREDATQAEFTCNFLDRATHGDRMLGHLALRLVIRKQQPHVAKFTLELRAPYSPTLAVKMNRLTMEANFSPPDGTRPALPARTASVFSGRIFFFSVEENLALTYSDFVRSG